MPITTEWYDDEKTIVLHRIFGAWSLDEVFTELRTCAPKLGLSEGDIPTYFIIDMHHAFSIPKLLYQVKDEYETMIDSDNTMTVVVGASRLIKAVTQSLERLGVNINTIFVDTYAEAENIINQHKAGLHQKK